jgi:hypothetical protein
MMKILVRFSERWHSRLTDSAQLEPKRLSFAKEKAAAVAVTADY